MEPELFIQLLVVNHPVWAAMDMVNDLSFMLNMSIESGAFIFGQKHRPRDCEVLARYLFAIYIAMRFA